MNRILLGQRLAFGFEGTCIPENFAALVREYKIGNVILFRRNIENNDQLRQADAGSSSRSLLPRPDTRLSSQSTRRAAWSRALRQTR